MAAACHSPTHLPTYRPTALPTSRLTDRQGAVCYEIFVRSFSDSDGNGIGDLNGLTAKLDYVSSLGASCIWLMPVAESPSYHGYDVSDYYKVEPDYGTATDFRKLVAEAHRRGIAVLVDMVLNHASSEHASFRAALSDTASPYRAWYRWSPTSLGKGPWGAEAWHKSPVRDEYYYGVFSRVMPDLDYDSPAVREEARKVATYWLRDMGVDGFRLDAVPYIAEEGSCLKDCPGTHAFLREYAAHLDSITPGVYTVGEVWDSFGRVLPYYPDQLTSYFTFDLADSLRIAVQRGAPGGLLAGYMRYQDTMPAYRWSPFLSNHDGRRIMTAFGGDFAKARVAATLLLTLPGLPFVYYGEEIGMTGDKPDRLLRRPMQWKPGRGTGFTTGTPWEAAGPDSMTTTVEAQDPDSASLLNLYRRLIRLRRENPALAGGRLVPLAASGPGVIAYLRRDTTRVVLIVANLGPGASTLTISSAPGALPAGTYRPRNLLGGPDGAALEIGSDGRFAGYAPLGSLGPRSTLIFELIRR